MFKAQRTDGKGWVTGWLIVTNWMSLGKKYFIVPENHEISQIWHGWAFSLKEHHEVIPSTISMKTFQKDKNGEDIYGSFYLEGYGMTDYQYNVLWQNEKCSAVFTNGIWMLFSKRVSLQNSLNIIDSIELEIIKQENKESGR